MRKQVKAVLNLIKDLDIEEEIKSFFGIESQEAPAASMVFRRQNTSNGYAIYYDETNGEAVGIFYKNLVFLKMVSDDMMSWPEAVAYCKNIVINGITAELCPVTDSWITEFKENYAEIKAALAEIGARKLDYATWCSVKDERDAWKQSFNNGHVSRAYQQGHCSGVRPVLVLRR